MSDSTVVNVAAGMEFLGLLEERNDKETDLEGCAHTNTLAVLVSERDMMTLESVLEQLLRPC